MVLKLIINTQWLPVFYLLVTMGVSEICMGFSLNHFIWFSDSLGATSPHTTECELREVPSLAKPNGPTTHNVREEYEYNVTKILK